MLNIALREHWLRTPHNYNLQPICIVRSAYAYPRLRAADTRAHVSNSSSLTKLASMYSSRGGNWAASAAEGIGRARILHFARLPKPWTYCDRSSADAEAFSDIWRLLEARMVQAWPAVHPRRWSDRLTSLTHPHCLCATVDARAPVERGQHAPVASLSCPTGQVMTQVVFASWGSDHGYCHNFFTSECHSSAHAVVASRCLGKASCHVPVDAATLGEPKCTDGLELAVQVKCSNSKSSM